MPTKSESKDIQLATLYKLRLIVKQATKQDYTKDEVLELLDQIAAAKEED